MRVFLEYITGFNQTAAAGMKAKLSARDKEVRRKRRIWALRILRLLRFRAISDAHPDAQEAYRIIGHKEALDIIAGNVEPGPKPRGGASRQPPPHADAMDRRLPGSFESSRRRH
jgi:hypothetical protein